jgi:hypothetical protein
MRIGLMQSPKHNGVSHLLLLCPRARRYSSCRPKGSPLTKLVRGLRGSILKIPDRSGCGSTPSKLLIALIGIGRPPPGSGGRLKRPRALLSWLSLLPRIRVVMLWMIASSAL